MAQRTLIAWIRRPAAGSGGRTSEHGCFLQISFYSWNQPTQQKNVLLQPEDLKEGFGLGTVHIAAEGSTVIECTGQQTACLEDNHTAITYCTVLAEPLAISGADLITAVPYILH